VFVVGVVLMFVVVDVGAAQSPFSLHPLYWLFVGDLDLIRPLTRVDLMSETQNRAIVSLDDI
jgi:hypothetical protein